MTAAAPRRQKENKMAVMPIGRLVANMSLPLMLSLLVQSLYNIVDSIFVSRIGEEALTATSLAYPIQILMIAVGVGTAVGVNALLSRRLGAGKTEEAGMIAASGLMLSTLSAAVFALLGALLSGKFAAMFTSDGAIASACASYLRVCMLFCLGTFTETMFQRFLQATGNTLLSMVSLIAGALTNLILDPIMIFGLLGFPRLGVTGAAIATVTGQWVGAATAAALHFLKNPMVKIRLRGFRPRREIILPIYQVGLPTAVTQAMGSVMVSSFNAILMSFSPTAVAFFGVYYKLQSFLFMPMHGLGQAAIPIVGYNFGAKNGARIQRTLRVLIPAGVTVALLATLVFCLFPQWLLSLFNAGTEMCEIGIPALRIISATFALSTVTMLLGYCASGLGNGMISMLCTAVRQFIVFVPLAYLFARLFGVSYVWYAVWVSELTAFLMAIALFHREKKRKLAPLTQGQNAQPA